jgi:hypothetical protein
MPIIPILQKQRPTTDAAAPVLDRERRPTLDTGEVQAGLRRVNEAGKMPLMDPQAMAAPYDALGSVGRAVQQAGNVLGALAIKRQEAEALHQSAEFEKRLALEVSDFEQWKRTKLNVPGEWEPEWQKRLGKLRQEYGADQKLNRLAREQIGLRLTRWEGKSMADVSFQATTHTFELGKSAIIASADTAAANGDWDEHARIIQRGQAGGFLFPHVANAKMLEARQNQIQEAKLDSDTALAQNDLEGAKAAIAASPMPEAQKKNELANLEFRHGQKMEYDALTAMSFENPEMAAELAAEKEKAGKLTPLMRVNLQERAKFNRASMIREAVADYKGRLEIGEKIEAETLDNDPRLNDEARAAVARMADGIQNMPAEFERALVQAMAYDPATFGSEMEAITRATNLEASFEAAFSGARLQSLKAELDKRRRGVDIATAATDIGPALKLLDESIDAGGLDDVVGPVRVPERDEAGNVILEKTPDVTVRGRFERGQFGKAWYGETHYTGDKTIKGGEMVPKMQADPVASEKAAAIQREIRRTIEAEVKAGKLKSQEEIAARALDLFTLKGGKMRPRMDGPNEILPAEGARANAIDLNEFIDTYGN